ncbi:terpene synthase family protein [Myxococcus fulvus]|uniref:terpene synthase family protein n=1 Tax=Myxococcus fulvus TaxID=33 RepID=UPI003B9D9303
MPFVSLCHPDLEGARQRNLEWARRVGLVVNDADAHRLLLWGMAGLFAHWLPRAPKEGLDLAIDTITIGVFLEDHLEGALDQPPDFVIDACAEMLAVISPGGLREPSSVLSAAFVGLWERLCEGASPEWKRRVTLHWRWFIEAYIEEARRRDGHVHQTVDGYQELRRTSGFVHVMVDLSERANGFALPDKVRNIPSVERIVLLTVDIIDAMNDVCSLEKEIALGDVHNLIFVLRDEQGLSLEQATAETYALMRGWCEDIIQLEARLPEDCVQHQLTAQETEDLLHFVRALKEGIGGHPTWYSGCGRYDNASSPRAVAVGTTSPMRPLAVTHAHA